MATEITSSRRRIVTARATIAKQRILRGRETTKHEVFLPVNCGISCFVTVGVRLIIVSNSKLNDIWSDMEEM